MTTRSIEAFEKERADVIRTLRSLCDELGDNNWEDDLHLSDIIHKHLANYVFELLEKSTPTPASERLPVDAGEVYALFTLSGLGWQKAWFNGNRDNPSFTYNGMQYSIRQVAYWLPLPLKPD